MHKIIEQAAVLCGMLKTPNPSQATKEAAANGQYRHRPRRTQEPHRRNEARSEAQPQAQDAHRAARRRRALAHRDLPRPLLLARHPLRGRIGGHWPFDDRRKRGPRPLLSKKADQRVERLLEEDSPTSHGWLRSRWSCKLIALQLLRECAASASPETLRRALHRLGFRWRRPRPVPPEKDSEEHIEQKRARLEDVLQMTEQEAGSFFQDETKLETNPKVGFCWMRKANRSSFPPREPTARYGLAGLSTSRRGASIGCPGGAGTASFSSGCSTNSGEPTPLPQTTAPCGGQRLKPHQQTGEEIRGGLGGSRQSAPFAFVVS